MGSLHGFEATFGRTTYGVMEAGSLRSAILNVYTRAYEAGDWRPEKIRRHWWQLHLPKEYSRETQIFLDAHPYLSGKE